MKKGFSVVEVVLAAGIFAVFISGAVVALISGWYGNRQGADTAMAVEYASEGLEAVRSIKNRDYALVGNTAGSGIGRDGNGVWSFSGINNTTDSGRITRVIKVESVNRDGSGNIVPVPTGTVDTNTKRVISKVNWNLTAARPQEVSFSSYLTNWKAPIGASGGLLIYGENLITTPRYRTYDQTGNTFGGESSGPVGAAGKTFVIKTSPTKHEAVAGYVDTSGNLRILCFDGSSWSAEWGTTVGGAGETRRFDISYEKTSGDVLVVYSRGVPTTDEMGYRTKPGSAGCGAANWSGEIALNPVRTSGIVQWILMEGSPVSGSDNIALSWADAAFDLSAMIWTGSSWTIAEPSSALEINLERVSVSLQDVQSFDMAYEGVTGNLMIVWGLYQATGCTAGTAITTTNCIRYARYTSSWSAVAFVPTVADPATNIDISANSNTNELVLASLDNNQGDLSTAYWSGSAWTGRANVDIASHCVGAGEKLVATGWLINGAQTRSIIVYHDATNNTCSTGRTNVGWYAANGSGAPAPQTDFDPTPAFANPQGWYDIRMDPSNKNQLMLVVSDSGLDLFAKRLEMTAVPAFIWTNADGGAALETALGQATSSAFSFGYWIK